MAKLTSFRELLVWQKSMNLAERCYKMSRRFRRDDQLVLGNEIRKSCVSVPSNIAEGFGRHHTSEYTHHLRFSNGSNNELQTQVELGRRVEIIGEEEAAVVIADAEEVGRMLRQPFPLTPSPLPPFVFTAACGPVRITAIRGG